MYRQFYEGMSLSHLPLFTLILFIALFVGVVARTFILRRPKDFEAVSRLPLGDDDE